MLSVLQTRPKAAALKTRQNAELEVLIIALLVSAVVGVLCALTATTAKAAFSSCERALSTLKRGELELARNVRTDSLKSGETLGRGSRFVSGDATHRRDWSHASAGGGQASRIVRSLWRIKVSRAVSPFDLVVSHKISSEAGDRLSLETSDDFALDIDVVPLAPSVVCSNQSDHIIEGDAQVSFPLNEIPLAGRYRGKILTNVHVR